MKKYRVLWTVCMLVLLGTLAGCAIHREAVKLQDLEFSVLAPERVPQELGELIAEKIKEPFQMTYNDGEYLYLVEGYGEQPTGGYSVTVEELSLTENAIYVHTTLLGPGPGEQKKNTPSYPYIVIKTPLREEQVIFR